MKIFFLLPVISLLVDSSQVKFSKAFQADTTIISHLLDGNIAEWPEEKFMTDKPTKIRYAIDNDNQMLFLAMIISEKNVQQRIMQQGMTLFIDVKGKKKENRGVEFPLGLENVSEISNMRVFGFGNAEPVPQNVRTEGTINIAISWDSSYVLSVEYFIPLKMLGDSVTELNNKKIGIGWKLKESGVTTMTSQTVTTTTRTVAVSAAGSRPVSNRNTPNLNNNPVPPPASTKEQSIWTSHTIIF